MQLCHNQKLPGHLIYLTSLNRVMVNVIVPIGKCGISKHPTILEPQVKVAKPFFFFCMFSYSEKLKRSCHFHRICYWHKTSLWMLSRQHLWPQFHEPLIASYVSKTLFERGLLHMGFECFTKQCSEGFRYLLHMCTWLLHSSSRLSEKHINQFETEICL